MKVIICVKEEFARWNMTKVFMKSIPAAIIILALCAIAVKAGEIDVKADIEFTVAGGIPLKGDLYIPAGAGPFPGLLYLHGGGFVAGYRDWKTQLQVIRYLAENGFIVFSADYRLLQQGGVFPKNVKDAKCALCWLKKNGPDYGMMKDRVGVLGESAGGYLAAMIATTAGIAEFEPDCALAEGVDTSVLAAVPVYPPTHFLKMKNNLAMLLRNEITRMTGIKDKKQIRKMMIDNSPIKYASSSVPMLLMHGDKDVLVPVEQSRMLNEELKKKGREVEYYEAAGAVHGFLSDYFETEEARIGREKAVAFLKRYLLPDAEPVEEAPGQ